MEVQNKTEIILRPDELEEIAFGVAEQINQHYDNTTEAENDVVFCPILQGAIPFFADICKGVLIEPYVEYIGVSSYVGKEQQKQFNVYKVPVHDVIKGRTVWLFDDIADSGKTLDFFTKLLKSMGAREVKTCVLLKKKSCTYPVDVYGYELDDDMWVWGYGMDAPNGRCRTSNVLMGEKK